MLRHVVLLLEQASDFPHAQEPAGTLIVSPLEATEMQALISATEHDAAVQVGLAPLQAARAGPVCVHNRTQNTRETSKNFTFSLFISILPYDLVS